MADMAEIAFKRMIATLVRQTRPQTFRSGKPSRYPQRSLATAAATRPVTDDESVTPGWQPHTLAQPDPADPPSKPRLDKLRSDLETRPFSSFLTDNYAREHNYLRISVTERCNLRCLYCMPEEGIPLSPPAHNLTTPEIVYLSSLFVNQGVNKIRLTGGEPTVRKDIVDLMRQIGELRKDGLKELCLTTNGISLHRKLDAMVESGLTAVNLSLDTLDPFQFTIMTRRNGHDAVMKSINRILEMNKVGAGIKLKINCVVMRGMNEREIVPFVEMGKERDLEVRFIEYMPFDGNKWSQNKMLPFQEMLAFIREKYPGVEQVQGHANDTSKTYKIPGFAGRIGFITSMTHNFCGTCNRLRITSDGNLKVCLFGNSEVSLRDIMRQSNEGKPIDAEAMEAIKQIEMDRRQALSGSVGTLGLSPKESQLLDIIGMAVKRKKEAHADASTVSPNYPGSILNHSSVPPPSCLPSLRRRPASTSNIPLHLLSPSSILSMQRRYLTPRTISRAYRTDQSRHVYSQHSHRRVPTGPPEGAKNNHSKANGRPDSAVPTLQADLRTTSNLDGESEALNEVSATPDSANWAASTAQKIASHDPLQDFTFEDGIEISDEDMEGSKDDILSAPSMQSTIKDDEALSSKPAKDDKAPPRRLTHLTAQGEAHMVNITQKKDTVRSAKALTVVYFGNSDTLDALHSGTAQKGDALAVARIAGIQAAKKASDLIPLAHPGLSITGVEIEIKTFEPNPKKDVRRSSIHTNLDDIPQHGGVRITAIVECFGKTGVEMEALTAATVSALTVYDMLKGVDKEMLITSGRVLRKSGGKSGDWEWDATRRCIRRIHNPPKRDITTNNDNTTNLAILKEKLDLQAQAIHIGKAKLKQEAEALSLRKALLQLEHDKAKWREERLRYEKEKLEYLAGEQKIEKEKIRLANTNIAKEIQKGVSREGTQGSLAGSFREQDQEQDDLRDHCSGSFGERLNGGDFEQKRIERYVDWTKNH